MKLPLTFWTIFENIVEKIKNNEEIKQIKITNFVAQIIKLDNLIKISDSYNEMILNKDKDYDTSYKLLSESICSDNPKQIIMYGIYEFINPIFHLKLGANDELEFYISCNKMKMVSEGLFIPLYGKCSKISDQLVKEDKDLIKKKLKNKDFKMVNKNINSDILFNDSIIDFNNLKTNNKGQDNISIDKPTIHKDNKPAEKNKEIKKSTNYYNTIQFDVNDYLNINNDDDKYFQNTTDIISDYFKNHIDNLNNVFYNETNIYGNITLGDDKNKNVIDDILNNKKFSKYYDKFNSN